MATERQSQMSKSIAPAPQLLTVDEAANRLNVSVRFIRRITSEDGRIPYAKLGGHVRIDVEDLDRYVADNKVQPRT